MKKQPQILHSVQDDIVVGARKGYFQGRSFDADLSPAAGTVFHPEITKKQPQILHSVQDDTVVAREGYFQGRSFDADPSTQILRLRLAEFSASLCSG